MGICKKLVAKGGPNQRTLTKASHDDPTLGLFNRILAVCAIAGGGWMYSRTCHGVDACAAQSAEGHERDVPKEPH
jgi:hypothetical protein